LNIAPQAQDDGNVELKMKLENQLEELEERAEELDKKRTSSISTIGLVNDRNRKNNIKRAEISIIREAR
jgi:RNA polymerase-associated protein RTF1